jgi:hypothetical protein
MMIKWTVRMTGPIGLTALLLTAAACDSGGNPLEAITGTIPPPDEFQVMANKPLIMPTAGTLPEPRPGAASPLFADPHQDARQALLGNSDSVVVGSAAPSSGEAVLLASANAASASSEIRVQLEQEKIDRETNKPYEAPSLFGIFGASNGEKLDESTLLDPAVEARRLQGEGKTTPVDPNAAAEVGETRPPPDKQNYPTGRPQSPIKAEGTDPTY